MKTISVLVLVLLATPAFAGSKGTRNWETIYHWCANAAPEYLFDASFDEWIDECMSNRGKKKRQK